MQPDTRYAGTVDETQAILSKLFHLWLFRNLSGVAVDVNRLVSRVFPLIRDSPSLRTIRVLRGVGGPGVLTDFYWYELPGMLSRWLRRSNAHLMLLLETSSVNGMQEGLFEQRPFRQAQGPELVEGLRPPRT